MISLPSVGADAGAEPGTTDGTGSEGGGAGGDANGESDGDPVSGEGDGRGGDRNGELAGAADSSVDGDGDGDCSGVSAEEEEICNKNKAKTSTNPVTLPIFESELGHGQRGEREGGGGLSKFGERSSRSRGGRKFK